MVQPLVFSLKNELDVLVVVFSSPNSQAEVVLHTFPSDEYFPPY